MSDMLAIKAVTVGTHGGNILSSKMKDEFQLNPKEVVAATTSILFLSSKAITAIARDKDKCVISFGPKYILLSYLTRNISFGVILDRKLVELDGIENYIDKINEIALKISAIVEDDKQMDLFSKIKVSIPDANMYAITTREGLPIKIQAENLDEARVSAFISAIFNVNNLITGEDAEFTSILGQEQSIIIHALDNHRLLALGVSSGDSSKIMKYVMKIKELIN
jgi:predicted regulator of Ras-like GTPase activity (Roadblock/LC7/MglB family)